MRRVQIHRDLEETALLRTQVRGPVGREEDSISGSYWQDIDIFGQPSNRYGASLCYGHFLSDLLALECSAIHHHRSLLGMHCRIVGLEEIHAEQDVVVKGPCFRLESSGKESPLARQPSLWRHASGTSLERA